MLCGCCMAVWQPSCFLDKGPRFVWSFSVLLQSFCEKGVRWGRDWGMGAREACELLRPGQGVSGPGPTKTCIYPCACTVFIIPVESTSTCQVRGYPYLRASAPSYYLYIDQAVPCGSLYRGNTEYTDHTKHAASYEEKGICVILCYH